MKKVLFLFVGISCLFTSCSNEFDGKDGIKTVYFPNSEKIQQIVEYKDGKRIGELKEYYRNGKLKLKQFYVNDTLDDSAFFYHENGNIKYFQYLKKFKKEGTWKKFNEKGMVYEEINFKDDELHGASVKYTYRTGRVLERLNYEHGMKEGKQEFYYNNGKPKAIVYYHMNNPALGTEEWNEKGDKINNDFNIYVREQDKLLLENKMNYFVKLERSQPDDAVYLISDTQPEKYAVKIMALANKKDEFLLEYRVGVGGFVMEKVKIAAYRKTAMGNIFVKVKQLTVAANNF